MSKKYEEPPKYIEDSYDFFGYKIPKNTKTNFTDTNLNTPYMDTTNHSDVELQKLRDKQKEIKISYEIKF